MMKRRTFSSFVTLTAGVIGLLHLASCSSEPEPNPKPKAAGERRSSVPKAREPAPPVVPPGADATAATGLPRLAVDAEGLRLFAPATGTSRPLPFGLPQQQLLAALEPLRGPADGGTNSECGAGPLDYAVWADGITLHFQDGRFAGWTLDERAEGALATAAGIGPGSTRRALDAAYEAQVSESSLGTEFEAGGLYGVLNGSGPEARIGTMWAGVSCVFR